MNEQNYPSAQVMIKIDGARIRAIREAKGLTQLYIATAVDVTTDTVSRWENKRYPSIKKENGLKLAEALEVELEDILDIAEQSENITGADTPEFPASENQTTVVEAETIDLHADSQTDPPPYPQTAGRHWYNNIGHFGIILITIILICAGFYVYTVLHQNPAAAEIEVTRVVPPHFIAGQPLPVFLHVKKTSDKPVSIILKEDLPPGCRLEAASPLLSGSSATEIKWLTTISQSALFFYTVVTDPSFSGDLSFTGIVKNGLDDEAVQITGGRKTVSGSHHWVDTNGDNRISDEEILMVYDLLLGDTGQIIDLDQLEEMWLGDGYVWSPDQQAFTIME